MNTYLRQDQIEAGLLVRSKSIATGAWIPALIITTHVGRYKDFVRVLDVEGETSLLNRGYLERWK
jgi:hypothetical protein